MSDPILDAWAAIRAALAATPAVTAQVPADRIFDHVPESAVFPYIRLGDAEVEPDDTDGVEGVTVSLAVEVYTRPAYGRATASRACTEIRRALHRKPEALSVAGFDLIEAEAVAWTLDQESDGLTWRGVVVIELRLES